MGWVAHGTLIDPTMSVNQDISFRAMFSNLTRLHHTLWLTSDENCPDSSFNLCRRRMNNQGNSNQHICMVKNVMASSRLFIENQTTSLSSQKWLEGNFAENRPCSTIKPWFHANLLFNPSVDDRYSCSFPIIRDIQDI